MKKLTNRWIRLEEDITMLPRFNRMHLGRTFVETGDERCPIAGIWSRLESDAPADDGELPRPVMRRLFPWRAFLFPLRISSLRSLP